MNPNLNGKEEGKSGKNNRNDEGICAYNFKAHWKKFRKLLRDDKITFYFKNIDESSLGTRYLFRKILWKNMLKSSEFHEPSTRCRHERSQLIFLCNGSNHSAETHLPRYWRHVSKTGIQNESLARINAWFTYPLGFKRASVNLLLGRYGEKLNLRRNCLSLHMRATPGLFLFSFPGMISNEFSARGHRLQSERAVRRNW